MDTNIGKQGLAIAIFGGDMITVAFELRYMIIFSAMLILCDLWWGHSDSMKRYCEAKDSGDAVGMDKYKWHKSRALRRTANKLVDYLTYLILGAFVGLAITEPMGGCSHIITAAIGLSVGCLAEVASIVGHYCYVKWGIEIKVVDVWRWLLRFVVNIFKVKSNIGNALEETINDSKKEE